MSLFNVVYHNDHRTSSPDDDPMDVDQPSPPRMCPQSPSFASAIAATAATAAAFGTPCTPTRSNQPPFGTPFSTPPTSSRAPLPPSPAFSPLPSPFVQPNSPASANANATANGGNPFHGFQTPTRPLQQQQQQPPPSPALVRQLSLGSPSTGGSGGNSTATASPEEEVALAESALRHLERFGNSMAGLEGPAEGGGRWRERQELLSGAEGVFREYLRRSLPLPPPFVAAVRLLEPLVLGCLADPHPPVVIAALRLLQSIAQASGPHLPDTASTNAEARWAAAVLPLLRRPRNVHAEAEAVMGSVIGRCATPPLLGCIAGACRDHHAGMRARAAQLLLAALGLWQQPPWQGLWSVVTAQEDACEVAERLVQDADPQARQMGHELYRAVQSRWVDRADTLLAKLRDSNPAVARALLALS